jgi:hypothetical protein
VVVGAGKDGEGTCDCTNVSKHKVKGLCSGSSCQMVDDGSCKTASDDLIPWYGAGGEADGLTKHGNSIERNAV